MKKLLLLPLASLVLSGCWETTNGDKIGSIVKCAYEGLFIKTYECEIIRGGLASGGGSFGKSFDFTVEDKSLIPIIQRSMDEQKEVKIKYHKEFATLWRTETSDNSFLNSIEIINGAK